MPTTPEMSRARITFECSACSNYLCLEPPRFTITLGGGGITASPEWSCPCGLRGRVLRGKVMVLGRISVPPTHHVIAGTHPGLREAVVFDKKVAAPAPEPEPIPEPEPEPEVEVEVEVEVEAEVEVKPLAAVDPADCPEKSKHGVHSRLGNRCPICKREPKS